MIRLVASDLDGTLLRTDRTVSARTLSTVDALGVPFVVVTGRPVRWLSTVELKAPLTVCANGAVVYDGVVDEIVAQWPLSPGQLHELVAVIAGAVSPADVTSPDARVAPGRATEPRGALFAVEVDGSRRIKLLPGYPSRDADAGGPAYVADIDELCTEPAAKLLVRPAGDRPPSWLEDVTTAVGEHGEVTYSSTGGLLEVSAPGVTKASGLAWVADRLGVPASDVVAFGDMPNDLPMLRWAGHPVAVANAHRQVLGVADVVTSSNDEDGVAAYLESIGLASTLPT